MIKWKDGKQNTGRIQTQVRRWNPETQRIEEVTSIFVQMDTEPDELYEFFPIEGGFWCEVNNIGDPVEISVVGA